MESYRRYRLLSAVFAAIATLGFLLAFITVVTSSPAEAVTAKCKRQSVVVPNKLVRGIEGPASANYMTKTWFTGCPKADGFQVWRLGAKFRFPKGYNPCNRRFAGVRGDYTFLPRGGSSRIVLDSDCDGRAKRTKNVNIFVPELIAPPQPHLSRLVTWRTELDSMWGGGKGDHHKSQSDSMRY